MKKYPDIDEKIEEFVKSNNVGADQWHRTGVLTFDGDLRNSKKVTYSAAPHKYLWQITVVLYNYVLQETKDAALLLGTKVWHRLPPEGNETVSNYVITQTSTGVTLCTEDWTISK